MMSTVICKRCVMDSTIPGVTFDERGYCSECEKYFAKLKHAPFYQGNGEEKFKELIEEIKSKGQKNKYDCVVGLSGGIDSSYVLHLVVKNGLRPLVVHLDNGWNAEVSEDNIKKLVQKLGVEIKSFSVDKEEFKELQKSFLYASTPHCEHPTDHAILGLIYKVAAENNVQFIISGSNVSTEGIGVSVGSIGQRDWKYIKSVYRKMSGKKLVNYAHFSMKDMMYYKLLKKQKTVNILNYIDYNKDEIIKFLAKEYDWEYYGGKHFESVFTRFFQAYILPVKFGIDKRKAHFSALIMSGQMSRENAMELLKQDPYPSDMFENDKKIFLEKLDISEEEFNEIMSMKINHFEDFDSYEKSVIINLIKKTYLKLKPIFKF